MEQPRVAYQQQKREFLEMQYKQMELRVTALKMGFELYVHESMLHKDDEDFENLVNTPVDNAEEFYEFLRG